MANWVRWTVCLPVLLTAVLALESPPAEAQISATPGQVSMRRAGAGTFFVQFTAAPGIQFTSPGAQFCTAVDLGPLGFGRCVANSVLGVPSPNRRVPSLTDRFAEVVTVPAAVVRKAVTAGVPQFFYVREFPENAFIVNPVFTRVAVRLNVSQATAPLSLDRVEIYGDEPSKPPVRFIEINRANRATGTVKADIEFSGTGLLVGWWEVRTPADPPITVVERRTDASLSDAELRARRLFRRVKRIRVNLTPSGRVTLTGPKYARLPSNIPGRHEIFLHIERVPDPRNLASLGATASFALPVLDYRVGSAAAVLGDREIGVAVAPADIVDSARGTTSEPGGEREGAPPAAGPRRLALTWTPVPDPGLVVEVAFERPDTGETLRLLARMAKGSATIPAKWLSGLTAGSVEVDFTILGADRRPVAEPRRITLELPQ